MARSEAARFSFRQYGSASQQFENELVAQLPGLLITQFTVPQAPRNGHHGSTGLRFDFMDDWYSVVAYLDDEKRPTGYYRISCQSPLHKADGTWKGVGLVLEADVEPDWQYSILHEEEFIQAVEDGWMRVYSAAKARQALRDICKLLDAHSLPQEVMDALGVETGNSDR